MLSIEGGHFLIEVSVTNRVIFLSASTSLSNWKGALHFSQSKLNFFLIVSFLQCYLKDLHFILNFRRLPTGDLYGAAGAFLSESADDGGHK